jgi:hypothetical protein
MYPELPGLLEIISEYRRLFPGTRSITLRTDGFAADTGGVR